MKAEGVADGFYNVAFGERIALNQLVEQLCRAMGKSRRPVRLRRALSPGGAAPNETIVLVRQGGRYRIEGLTG